MINQDAAIPEGDFYVTVRDAGRTGFLLGPYQDYRDALANQRRGADLAQKADCRAAFYAYGTSRLPIGTACRTVFGR
jgi:hypothetical protein